MNLKEYIESGKLEAYVLGGLSDSETREVERFAKEFPEIAHELNKIQSGFEKYIISLSEKPAARLREELLDAVNAPRPASKSGKHLGMYVAMAASIALLLVFSGLSWYFYQQWNETQSVLAHVQQEKEILNKEASEKNNTIDQLLQYKRLVSDTNVIKISLAGTVLQPQAKAVVFYNKHTHEIYLDPTGLPSAPPHQQYQLWAIIDGKPVDMGVVSKDLKVPVHPMKSAPQFQALAITLEILGGSSFPTLEAMYVLGQRG
ncbi:MAG: anti-sigma factor [Cytophagaceae bacterium]|jgi:anti-sigma-K factor RskA|nr:anti-sigma factor [Cytophagaceae bacterium]